MTDLGETDVIRRSPMSANFLCLFRLEQLRLPCTGIAVKRGTEDELDGNSTSRAEKQLERAQKETVGDWAAEEEGAG